MDENTKYHTDKNGAVKYYASHRSAWAAAARLNNNTTEDGIWLFEADMTGWFVFFSSHGKVGA